MRLEWQAVVASKEGRKKNKLVRLKVGQMSHCGKLQNITIHYNYTYMGDDLNLEACDVNGHGGIAKISWNNIAQSQ